MTNASIVLIVSLWFLYVLCHCFCVCVFVCENVRVCLFACVHVCMCLCVYVCQLLCRGNVTTCVLVTSVNAWHQAPAPVGLGLQYDFIISCLTDSLYKLFQIQWQIQITQLRQRWNRHEPCILLTHSMFIHLTFNCFSVIWQIDNK